MRKTYYLCVLFIMFYFLIISNAHAQSDVQKLDENVYTWIDEKGIQQFSNRPPRRSREVKSAVEILDSADTLSNDGVFKKNPDQHNELLAISDEEWNKSFADIGKTVPEMPLQKKDALIKARNILSNSEVLINSTNKRLLDYINDYAKRKELYEEEFKEHEQSIKNKLWRLTTRLESNEEYEEKRNKLLNELKYHELLVKWAKQKIEQNS